MIKFGFFKRFFQLQYGEEISKNPTLMTSAQSIITVHARDNGYLNQCVAVKMERCDWSQSIF